MVESKHFGIIEVKSQDVIFLPDGILGFESMKRFTLLPLRPELSLKSLQSLEEPALAFVVIDPMQVRPDYHPSILKNDLTAIGVKDLNEATMYALVSVSPGANQITANLLAPLVVNSRLGIGRQVVLMGDDYSVRHDILKEWQLFAEESLKTEAKKRGA